MSASNSLFSANSSAFFNPTSTAASTPIPPTVTSLHAAIEKGEEESLCALLNQLKACGPAKRKEILLAQDDQGWNALHVAAKHGNYETVIAVINALDDDVKEAAEMFDNLGRLPLELTVRNLTSDQKEFILDQRNLTSIQKKIILEQKKPTPDQKKIRKLFKFITIHITNEDINSPIIFKELLAKNPSWPRDNEALLKNLNYACIAATHVRSIIKQSITHLNSNGYDQKYLDLLFYMTQKLRDEYKELNKKLTFQNDDDRILKELANRDKTIKSYGIGACGEYAYLVMNLLIKMGCSAPVEMFNFPNGDHVFVVIGRNLNTPNYDYKMWGPNAVVVDAWSGEIYPANELPQKLKDYFGYINSHKKLRGNITIPFIPAYHRIKVAYSLSDQFYAKKRPGDFSDLTAEEVESFKKGESLIHQESEERKNRFS